MKQALNNRICWVLLIVLAVGWFLPVSAEAESESDGWVEEDGRMYFYADGEALQGCIAEIEGAFYCFRDDGTLLLEDETCLVGDGAFWVRAGWDNILLAGQWYTDDTKDPAESYFYGEDFAAACGPTQIDGELYLFDSESGLLLCNQKVLIGDSWWESDYQGRLSPLPEGQAPEEEQGDQDTEENPVTPDGWASLEGEKYYYWDGQAFSDGWYTIENEKYCFDADGRMLHDCIADDCVLDSDGCVIPGGLVRLADEQYYVNPDNGRVVKNTEVVIDNALYIADAEGRLQKKELPAEPAAVTEPKTLLSQTYEAMSGTESEPDPDDGYVPVNEDDGGVQETLPAGGSIRYSDDYESDGASSAGEGADAAPASDNPSSGMLLWREGEWVELHGSPENPIEIHIYGRRAAFMNGGTALRDAFLCNSEGVYGFDSFGGALPAGFVTRYGKLFYLSAPDPDAEMLVLLLS